MRHGSAFLVLRIFPPLTGGTWKSKSTAEMPIFSTTPSCVMAQVYAFSGVLDALNVGIWATCAGNSARRAAGLVGIFMDVHKGRKRGLMDWCLLGDDFTSSPCLRTMPASTRRVCLQNAHTVCDMT